MSNMAKRLRVLLDVDDVLAKFSHAWLAICRRELPEFDIRAEEIGSWNIFEVLSARGVSDRERLRVEAICRKETGQEGFCIALGVMEDAVDGVMRLKGLADVFAVTSHWDGRHWTFERDAWIGEHFHIGRKWIVHTEAKFVVKGDVLIDDKPAHIEAWCAEFPDGVGVLFGTADNEHAKLPLNAIRRTSWPEIIKLIELIHGGGRVPQVREARVAEGLRDAATRVFPHVDAVAWNLRPEGLTKTSDAQAAYDRKLRHEGAMIVRGCVQRLAEEGK